MTHPFHPWCGAEFVLIGVRHTWGEDRVFFFAEDGTQKSLPTGWTDAAELDPVVVLGAGRSPLRVADLLGLAELIDGLRSVAGRRKV